MNANKVNPGDLVTVRWLWDIYLYKQAFRFSTGSLKAAFRDPEDRFIGVNFSKLTDNIQIFRNDFVWFIIPSVKFRLKLLSANFTPYELYNNYLVYDTALYRVAGTASQLQLGATHYATLKKIFWSNWLNNWVFRLSPERIICIGQLHP